MRIREFSAGDAVACCAIINACVPLMSGLNDVARRFIVGKNTPATIGSELHRMFALVGETSTGIVGVGALDGFEIKRLYVAPSAQGGGVGTRLLVELEAEARRPGVPTLYGEAAPSSLAFFERAGFVSTGERQLQREDALFTVHRIQKELRSIH